MDFRDYVAGMSLLQMIDEVADPYEDEEEDTE